MLHHVPTMSHVMYIGCAFLIGLLFESELEISAQHWNEVVCFFISLGSESK